MSERSPLSPHDAACVKKFKTRPLWVPSNWHRKAFEAAGACNVQVLHETVDTTFFAPAANRQARIGGQFTFVR